MRKFKVLLVWAKERGGVEHPVQNACEFGLELVQKFPEITSEPGGLANLYGRAAFEGSVPAGLDLEPVKKVGRYLVG